MRRWAVAAVLVLAACTPVRAIDAPTGLHVRLRGLHIDEPLCGPFNVVIDESHVYLDGNEIALENLEKRIADPWPDHCERRMIISAAPTAKYSELLAVLAVASRARFESVSFAYKRPDGRVEVI